MAAAARWIVVLLIAGCASETQPNPATPGRYRAWSGVVTSSIGVYDAGLYIRQDDDGGAFAGSYVTGKVGLTGAVSGSFDAGYVIHIRPTACDGGFDGFGAVDGGMLIFGYSGASCAGQHSGSGVLTQDYDLPAH